RRAVRGAAGGERRPLRPLLPAHRRPLVRGGALHAGGVPDRCYPAAVSRSKPAVPEGAREVARGRYLTFVNDNGWEDVIRANTPGIVVIVAITDDDGLLLVEQWRPAVRNRVIELPAGLVGDVDAAETLVDAAGRELVEETGFSAREMVPVGAG